MANTSVKVYQNPNEGGETQTVTADTPDLTLKLTNGASSIKMGGQAGTWQAFPQVNYQGSSVNLNAGQVYNSPTEMGLGGPVMSMRKA